MTLKPCALTIGIAFSLTPCTVGQDSGGGLGPLPPPPDEPQAIEPGDTTVRFFADAGASYQFLTDVDGEKDFAVGRLNASLGAKATLHDDFGMTFRVNYGLEDFEFEDPFFGAVFTADEDDPWETIHNVEFGFTMNLDVTDELAVFAGPIVRFAVENGGDWGDAITAGGIFGGSYRFNSDLVLGGGLGVVSELEDDVRVFPLVIVDWAFADDWRISSRSFDQATIANGIELVYGGAGDWEFAVGGGFRHARFRLDDDGVAPDGIGEDEAIPLWFRTSWQASPRVRLSGLLGMMTEGELKLEAENGDNIESVDYDPAWFIGLFGRIDF